MQSPDVCPQHDPARDANPRPERPTSDPSAIACAERSECFFCGVSVYGETVCAVCRVECANGEPEWPDRCPACWEPRDTSACLCAVECAAQIPAPYGESAPPAVAIPEVA